MQLVLTLYLAGIAAGQLVYGPASDRFGRRPVLIAGLAMFLAGTALCGARLVAAGADRRPRACRHLGACAGIVLGRAIIRDVYDREAAARGLAIVMMAMTLAPAMSPTLGAYLAEWVDWRAIFVLLGALGAAVFVVGRGAARRDQPAPGPARSRRHGRAYGALLRSPAFVAFAVCSACTSASWFTFIASAPHLLSDALHQPPSTYGLMILLPMATYMLGNALAARFAQRIGSLRLLLAGRALAFAAALGLAVWWRFGGAQRLDAVRADRAGRDRRRDDPAGGDGLGAQHPAAARRHRLGADGFSADDGGGARQLRRRAAAVTTMRSA